MLSASMSTQYDMYNSCSQLEGRGGGGGVGQGVQELSSVREQPSAPLLLLAHPTLSDRLIKAGSCSSHSSSSNSRVGWSSACLSLHAPHLHLTSSASDVARRAKAPAHAGGSRVKRSDTSPALPWLKLREVQAAGGSGSSVRRVASFLRKQDLTEKRRERRRSNAATSSASNVAFNRVSSTTAGAPQAS